MQVTTIELDPTAPGVALEHLGNVTERDVRFGFVRPHKGASLALGTERRVGAGWAGQDELL